MDKIGIKIKSSDKITKCISSIRKYTNLSIGGTKDRIISNDYVIICEYIDKDGIKLKLMKINRWRSVRIRTACLK